MGLPPRRGNTEIDRLACGVQHLRRCGCGRTRTTSALDVGICNETRSLGDL